MVFTKESEVKNYIDKKEQEQWLSGLYDAVVDLAWLEKETKQSVLYKWLKNDESLLSYAELSMKTEKLNIWESIKYRLLELKLSISCPYFADFKDFLQELKRWTDTSTTDTTETTTSGTTHRETTSESSEASTHSFCWKRVSSIKSEPYERNSRTWVTWCSKTARNNWKNFWLIVWMLHMLQKIVLLEKHI